MKPFENIVRKGANAGNLMSFGKGLIFVDWVRVKQKVSSLTVL